MSKKYLSLALCILASALVMTSCGDVDSSSGNDAQTGNDSISSKTSGGFTIRMDNNKLHDGVEFDDEELTAKAESFTSSVKTNYTPLEDYQKDEETEKKGVYISIESGETDIYISDFSENIVRINSDVYETTGGETVAFADELIKYLTDNGYWG